MARTRVVTADTAAPRSAGWRWARSIDGVGRRREEGGEDEWLGSVGTLAKLGAVPGLSEGERAGTQPVGSQRERVTPRQELTRRARRAELLLSFPSSWESQLSLNCQLRRAGDECMIR